MTTGLAEMTHFYCEVCRGIRPAFFEGTQFVDVSGKFIGGDMCCTECTYIIATAYKEAEK